MKLTNKQLKQIIKEELSYVLNEMSGGLDVLKSNMDMFEYNLVKGSARNPDSLQGYGLPSLASFENGFYIHDSYATEDWVSNIQSRGGNLSGLIENPWNGSGAAGPFLAENESWSKLFQPIPGEDVEVVMSYNARPGGYEIDDLRLIVKTSDGRFAVDDQMSNSGFSQLYYESFTNPLMMNSSNETSVMIRLPASQLEGVEWVSVEVVANDIYDGLNVLLECGRVFT